jgi:hypothetical protein
LDFSDVSDFNEGVLNKIFEFGEIYFNNMDERPLVIGNRDFAKFLATNGAYEKFDLYYSRNDLMEVYDKSYVAD